MIKSYLKNSANFWKLYCLLYYKIIGKNKVGVNGSNNVIDVSDALLKNATIVINGDSNKVYIGSKVRFSGRINISGNDNVLLIEENCTIKSSCFWFEDDKNMIIIKKNTSIESNSELSVIEGTKIEVGEDSMISSEVYIRTGDSHSILDLHGTRINPSKDIHIDNHVWLGHRCTIQKGGKISENSIVASSAIVTKQFEQSNCILSGTPAKILKENINWDKNRI